MRNWNLDGGDYGLRFNYSLSRKSIVLDVGGFAGQWASDLYSRTPCCIHVFEPVKEYANRIARRFTLNTDIHVYPFGLGARTRTEEFIVAGDATSSIRQQHGAAVSAEIVSAVDWFVHNVSDESTISLIKINIEGGEYELLPALIESGLISRIECLQIQFHDISPGAASEMIKIRSMLAKTHSPIYQYDFVWDDWRIRT